MNPNPTGYPVFQQHANPMLYPIQGSSPANQQFAFYANSMPSYPQAKTPHGGHPLQQHPHQHQHQHQQPQLQLQQQHSFNAMPVTSSPGGVMMPPTMSQQSSGPHANLPFSTTSPYPPSTIATTTAGSPSHSQKLLMLPTTAVQATSQNMTASSNSNNVFSAQQRPPQPSNQPSPATATATATSTAAAAAATQSTQSMPTPAPSQTASRERARISAILDINSALLQEVMNLQATGKAGLSQGAPGSHQSSPTQEQHSASPVSTIDPQGQTTNASKPPAQKSSQEYVECMRRLQANLAYLATIANRAKKAGEVFPPAPAIMTPPPNMPNMNEMYAKLNELFPRVPRGPTSAQPQQKPGQPGALAVGDSGV